MSGIGWGKRLLGLAILAATVSTSLIFNQMGQAEQPGLYTIDFRRGTQLGVGSKTTLAQVVRDATVRDEAAIIVTGHTGTLGDAEANQALAAERARVIEERLTAEGLDATRIRALGVAGNEPLKRTKKEGDRAYQRRLARVEIMVRP